MPALGDKKRFCPQGHDTFIVGRKGTTCAVCAKPQQARWHKANRPSPRKYREYNLRHFYGLSLADYDLMLVSQNGLCKGCYTHHSQLNRGLFVDHNHATGKVRGLLCMNCNLIARKHATPEILRRLADYMERS